MSPGEVIALFAALMTVIGTPVGILYRQKVKDDDTDRANLVAAHALALEELRAYNERAMKAIADGHAREVAVYTRELADRDRRLEVADETHAQMIQMTLRSVTAGEKIGSAAREAVDRIATRSTDRRP